MIVAVGSNILWSHFKLLIRSLPRHRALFFPTILLLFGVKIVIFFIDRIALCSSVVINSRAVGRMQPSDVFCAARVFV